MRNYFSFGIKLLYIAIFGGLVWFISFSIFPENQVIKINIGDESQIDLYNTDNSGLKRTRKALSNIDEISVMEFDNADIVRNPIVSKILEVFPKK